MELQTVKKILKTLPAGFYGGNLYGSEEEAAALRVIHNKSPFRFYGPAFTDEAGAFEKEAAKFFGVKHALATNSGSGALLLALHALDVGPGDEVIIPGYLWVAISNTVILRGAVPVLCEIDETLNMDPRDLEKKITAHTKAAIVVSMFGGVADTEPIAKICKAKNVKLIEDISQACGGMIKGRCIGSFGDIAITSLQLNKMISAGEGGLVLTNSQELILRAQARHDMGYARSGGIASKANSYLTIGEGRRLTEIQAAIMREQLKRLPKMRKALLSAKNIIKKRIPNLPEVFSYRRIVDAEGDTGSTLTLIFNSAKLARRFLDVQREIFPKGELELGAREDTGLHVYKQITNLVQKTPALPDGFPWNHPKNKDLVHDYSAGTLPRTDDLLARAVGTGVPGGIAPLMAEAVGEAIALVLSRM